MGIVAAFMIVLSIIIELHIGNIYGSKTTYFDKVKRFFYWTTPNFVIPNHATEIGHIVCRYCSLLKSVTIPDSVTSIGGKAFSNCISLTSVTIGNSVTSIGYKAFMDCISLKEVYCKPITPPIGNKFMFSYYNDNIEEYKPIGCKIYVPRESVEAYKSAEFWSVYASYIVGYDF